MDEPMLAFYYLSLRKEKHSFQYGTNISNIEFMNGLVWKVTKPGGSLFHVIVPPVTIKKNTFFWIDERAINKLKRISFFLYHLGLLERVTKGLREPEF